MSKVTDRLDNQTIIELAKKQYETQQRSKVPGYTVKLPSSGVVYPESSPLRSGVVEMRHMTAYDEDILTNSSYIRDNIVLEKLVESLLITSVSVDDIIPTDLEAMVIAARIYGYGKQYPVTVTIPGTTNQVKREIDLSLLKFRNFELRSDEHGEFSYNVPGTGDKLKFRYLTNGLAKQIDPEKPIASFLSKCICDINGDRSINVIEDYIKYSFMASDSKEFRQYVINNRSGMVFDVEFEGEKGSTFTTGFQLGSDLFWF
jgi:hypothetical protein